MSTRGARSVSRFEAETARARASAEFVADQLTELYVPVRMHLSVTRKLFDRYFEPTTSDEEKAAIKHEWRVHNTAVREALMSSALYLEPAPEGGVDADSLVHALLEHLTQWETVYKLKYDYGVHAGPVFAGISEFGFRRFPDGVDAYFEAAEAKLRARLHAARTEP